MNRVGVTHRDSNPSNLYFVPVDGLQNRKRKNAKPESQKYLTAARRHVMRVVSRSRQQSKKRGPAVAHVKLIPRARGTKSVAQGSWEPQPKHDDGLIVGDVRGSFANGQTPYKTSAPNTIHTTGTNSPYAVQHEEVYQIRHHALGGSRLDPFVRWPVNITKRMQYLLDYGALVQVLTTDCRSVISFRSASWPLLNLDPGIFYHTLSIAAFCLGARYPTAIKEKLASEALFYYTMGLNSVNSRLGDKLQRHSDGMIVSIMGIAIHTLTRSTTHRWCWEMTQSSPRTNEGHTDQWAMHFRALKTILDHRGGVDSIDSNSAIRFWLYLMDVEGAANRDVQPFFQLPMHILPTTQTSRPPRKPGIAACLSIWMKEFPAQRAVIDIFVDLDFTITWLSEQFVVENGSVQALLSVDAIWLLPLVHRCLQLSRRDSYRLQAPEDDDPPFSRPRDEAFHDALRHAIILFLAPIRRCFGPPAGGTELHVTKLISELQICLVHRATLQLGPLILWMIVVGGLEACSLERDASWFFSCILDCCTVLGAKEFEDVKMTVKHAMSQLIWLEAAMSSAFALMMERLQVFMEVPERSSWQD